MNKITVKIILILLVSAVVFITAACSCSNKEKPSNTVVLVSEDSDVQSSSKNFESNSQEDSHFSTTSQDSTSVCLHTGERIVVNEVPATCSKPGLTAGEKCAECGEFTIVQVEIPKLMHTEEIINAITSTCKTHGKTEGKKCSVCGEILLEQTELPLLEHKPLKVSGTLPTCTENGLTDGEVCELCGETLKEQQVIQALGHTRHSEHCSSCGVNVSSIGLSFEEYQTGYALNGLGQCEDSDVIIPSTYNNKPVLKINSNVFNNTLSSVFIPSSVTSIESETFEKATSLQKVYIDSLSAWCKITFGNLTANPLYHAHSLFLNGEKVVKLTLPTDIYRVKEFAFCGANIEAVVLPDNLSLLNDIGEFAFYNCHKLWEIYNLGQRLSPVKGSMTYGYLAYYAKDIFISLSQTNITRENGLILHTKSNKVTLLGAFGDESNLQLPSTINAINSYAFYENNIIKRLLINSSVKEIGAYAFANSKIESIIVDKSSVLEKIGDGAFMSAKALTSISLPSSITEIGFDAFKDATALQYNSSLGINYLGNEVEKYLYLVNANALNNCQIENTTRIICSNAFVGCENLASIVIPDSVIEIGQNSFSGLKNLSQIKLSANLKRIKGSAFSGLAKLYSITLPSQLESIYSKAFEGCYCLVEVYNLSLLTINRTTDNGSVGLYALDIYSSALELSKLIIRSNQLVIYDGATTKLIACLQNSDSVVLPKIDEIYEFAFYGNNSLVTIQFSGTLSEWNAVIKPQKMPASLIKIVCVDQEALI